MTLPIDRGRGAVDHPGSQDLIQDIIDGENQLYTDQQTTAKAVQIANGSFEASAGSFVAATDNGGWTWTPSGLGTCAVTTNASNVRDGLNAVAITSGGTNTNGGTLESTSFIPLTENIDLWVNWFLKCSVAGVAVSVAVECYDYTQSIIGSALNLYKSVLNPTTGFAWYDSWITTPTGTRFMKFLITVGAASSASGTVYLDGMALGMKKRNTLISQNYLQYNIFTPTLTGVQALTPGTDGMFAKFTPVTTAVGSGINSLVGVRGDQNPFLFGRVKMGGADVACNKFFGFSNRLFTPADSPVANVMGIRNPGAGVFELNMDNAGGAYTTVNTTSTISDSNVVHRMGVWYDNVAGKAIVKIDNTDPVEATSRLPGATVAMGPQLYRIGAAVAYNDVQMQTMTLGMD